MRTTSLAWLTAALVGAATGWACGAEGSGDGDCPIGSKGCACTPGGACDFSLTCVDGYCLSVDGPGTGDDGATGMNDGMDDGADDNVDDAETGVDTGTPDDGMTADDSDDGPILDVGDTGTIDCKMPMGCQAIDMLFVLDASASMQPERQALAATNAFTQIVSTLEGLNCGDIAYRIGVTDDHNHGFFTPVAWTGTDPWFDSESMTQQEIVNAFNGAVTQLGTLPGPPVGCEHVLTAGVDLLEGDSSGFVRDQALLVLVLLTDVDDYGAYDQASGNDCGIGCATSPPNLMGLYDSLVAIKNGDAAGLASIVIAGDPNVNAGANFCNQPSSCCAAPGLDCEVFHADRLWQFAALLPGSNGYTANLCTANVPDAVETALTESIEIACMTYEPEG